MVRGGIITPLLPGRMEGGEAAGVDTPHGLPPSAALVSSSSGTATLEDAMEYALVFLGMVKAVIMADSSFIATSSTTLASMYGYPQGEWVQCVGKVGTGYAYRDGAFFARSQAFSRSGTAPAKVTTAGQTLTLTINGDGPHTITLDRNLLAVGVAQDIGIKVRTLTANDPANQIFFHRFRAVWNLVIQRYTLVVGLGYHGSVVVNGGTAAAGLKLGVKNGGTETAGDGE